MRNAINNGSTYTLLTTKQVAELLGLHPATLRIGRSKQTLDLPHVRIGGTVRYRLSDVEAFIQTNVHGGTE